MPPIGFKFKNFNLIWNNLILIGISQMCLQGLMISKLSASLLLVILSFVTSTLVACGSVRSLTMSNINCLFAGFVESRPPYNYN
jgi:hypothetical protein